MATTYRRGIEKRHFELWRKHSVMNKYSLIHFKRTNGQVGNCHSKGCGYILKEHLFRIEEALVH
jgi:hypothetical protein